MGEENLLRCFSPAQNRHGCRNYWNWRGRQIDKHLSSACLFLTPCTTFFSFTFFSATLRAWQKNRILKPVLRRDAVGISSEAKCPERNSETHFSSRDLAVFAMGKGSHGNFLLCPHSIDLWINKTVIIIINDRITLWEVSFSLDVSPQKKCRWYPRRWLTGYELIHALCIRTHS